MSRGSEPDDDLLVGLSGASSARVRLRRSVAVVVAVALLSGLATWNVWAAAAESVAELRGDIPTRAEVRRSLEENADRQDQTLAELTSSESELARLRDLRSELNEEQRELVDAIEVGRDNLTTLAVESYITGGDIGALEYLAAVEDTSDFSWRRHLVLTQAGSTRLAVAELDRLYSEADDAVRASLSASDQLREQIEDLELQLRDLLAEHGELSDVLFLAEAWDRTEIAVAEGRYGVAPMDKWEKLRWCESSDRYDAVSPSGIYRGAYQFDLATWETVGGSGDPAAATPSEQDARARELYARRGWQPWPVCGHFLR